MWVKIKPPGIGPQVLVHVSLYIPGFHFGNLFLDPQPHVWLSAPLTRRHGPWAESRRLLLGLCPGASNGPSASEGQPLRSSERDLMFCWVVCPPVSFQAGVHVVVVMFDLEAPLNLGNRRAGTQQAPCR